MSNEIRIADLFCGIGGFHLAFKNLGAKCVFACDNDPHARKTYEANFCDDNPAMFTEGHFAEDVAKVDAFKIPDFDVLCAGYPCQPFSHLGNKKGFMERERNRGNMFFEVLRLIKYKRPKAFFLENVRRLLTHDNGRTFKITQDLIRNQGYSFHYKIVKASDHGLPQMRPRLFMVGFRDELQEDSLFEFPKPELLQITMDDVFEGKCDKRVGYTLLTHYSCRPVGHKYNWENYIVDGKNRRITSKEGRRMMGIPDDFIFPVSEAQALKQLGNGVAVSAVKATAEKVLCYISHRKKLQNETIIRPIYRHWEMLQKNPELQKIA